MLHLSNFRFIRNMSSITKGDGVDAHLSAPFANKVLSPKGVHGGGKREPAPPSPHCVLLFYSPPPTPSLALILEVSQEGRKLLQAMEHISLLLPIKHTALHCQSIRCLHALIQNHSTKKAPHLSGNNSSMLLNVFSVCASQVYTGEMRNLFYDLTTSICIALVSNFALALDF